MNHVEEHSYTADQQREYRLYVTPIAEWMKLYGLGKEQAVVAAETARTD